MGRHVIAVIGIDRYHHWPRLSNAVRDARGAAALFERLGFEQITEALLDDRATGKAIRWRSGVSDDTRGCRGNLPRLRGSASWCSRLNNL